MEIRLGDAQVGSQGSSGNTLAVVPGLGNFLMISGTTEGVPYTSIHFRGDLAQDIVFTIGFILAIFGTYYGFSIGKVKKQSL